MSMSTSANTIGAWFDAGVEQKAAYMIVVCDTYDHDDYPVYTNGGDQFWIKHDAVEGQSMQRIMEVYDLSRDKASQLVEFRANNCPPRSALGKEGGQ